MNIFSSEHEGHDIMKINNWFEALQDKIEKSGEKNNQLIIMTKHGTQSKSISIIGKKKAA